MRIFWFLASKGGAGKTLLSMCLHRALYYITSIDPRNTLIMDLNTQNKDLFNVLRKSDPVSSKVLTVELFNRRLDVTVMKLREPNLYLATPHAPIDLSTYVVLPAKLAAILNCETTIVDTNLSLYTFHSLKSRNIEDARRELFGLAENFGVVDPIVFFIWTTGSITRHIASRGDGELYELKIMMDYSIRNLAHMFGYQPEVFSMRNVIVTVNSILWVHNTITMLKAILRRMQSKMLRRILMCEGIALYSFARLSRDVILKASRVTAEMIAAISGKRPFFRYIEPLYMLSLYHVLFGGSMEVLNRIERRVKVPQEMRILAEKLREVEPIKMLPANLYIVPPPAEVHDIIPFIFSSHLLGMEDLTTALGDEDADNLPYSLVTEQAKFLARYIEAYLKIREKAGTAK